MRGEPSGGRNWHHRTLCFAKGAGQAPYCVTVDFDSLEDKKVTVRDRDTMKQERVAIEELNDYLKRSLML